MQDRPRLGLRLERGDVVTVRCLSGPDFNVETLPRKAIGMVDPTAQDGTKRQAPLGCSALCGMVHTGCPDNWHMRRQASATSVRPLFANSKRFAHRCVFISMAIFASMSACTFFARSSNFVIVCPNSSSKRSSLFRWRQRHADSVSRGPPDSADESLVCLIQCQRECRRNLGHFRHENASAALRAVEYRAIDGRRSRCGRDPAGHPGERPLLFAALHIVHVDRAVRRHLWTTRNYAERKCLLRDVICHLHEKKLLNSVLGLFGPRAA